MLNKGFEWELNSLIMLAKTGIAMDNENAR